MDNMTQWFEDLSRNARHYSGPFLENLIINYSRGISEKRTPEMELSDEERQRYQGFGISALESVYGPESKATPRVKEYFKAFRSGEMHEDLYKPIPVYGEVMRGDKVVDLILEPKSPGQKPIRHMKAPFMEAINSEGWKSITYKDGEEKYSPRRIFPALQKLGVKSYNKYFDLPQTTRNKLEDLNRKSGWFYHPDDIRTAAELNVKGRTFGDLSNSLARGAIPQAIIQARSADIAGHDPVEAAINTQEGFMERASQYNPYYGRAVPWTIGGGYQRGYKSGIREEQGSQKLLPQPGNVDELNRVFSRYQNYPSEKEFDGWARKKWNQRKDIHAKYESISGAKGYQVEDKYRDLNPAYGAFKTEIAKKLKPYWMLDERANAIPESEVQKFISKNAWVPRDERLARYHMVTKENPESWAVRFGDMDNEVTDDVTLEMQRYGAQALGEKKPAELETGSLGPTSVVDRLIGRLEGKLSISSNYQSTLPGINELKYQVDDKGHPIGEPKRSKTPARITLENLYEYREMEKQGTLPKYIKSHLDNLSVSIDEIGMITKKGAGPDTFDRDSVAYDDFANEEYYEDSDTEFNLDDVYFNDPPEGFLTRDVVKGEPYNLPDVGRGENVNDPSVKLDAFEWELALKHISEYGKRKREALRAGKEAPEPGLKIQTGTKSTRSKVIPQYETITKIDEITDAWMRQVDETTFNEKDNEFRLNLRNTLQELYPDEYNDFGVQDGEDNPSEVSHTLDTILKKSFGTYGSSYPLSVAQTASTHGGDTSGPMTEVAWAKTTDSLAYGLFVTPETINKSPSFLNKTVPNYLRAHGIKIANINWKALQESQYPIVERPAVEPVKKAAPVEQAAPVKKAVPTKQAVPVARTESTKQSPGVINMGEPMPPELMEEPVYDDERPVDLPDDVFVPIESINQPEEPVSQPANPTSNKPVSNLPDIREELADLLAIPVKAAPKPAPAKVAAKSAPADMPPELIKIATEPLPSAKKPKAVKKSETLPVEMDMSMGFASTEEPTVKPAQKKSNQPARKVSPPAQPLAVAGGGGGAKKPPNKTTVYAEGYPEDDDDGLRKYTPEELENARLPEPFPSQADRDDQENRTFNTVENFDYQDSFPPEQEIENPDVSDADVDVSNIDNIPGLMDGSPIYGGLTIVKTSEQVSHDVVSSTRLDSSTVYKNINYTDQATALGIIKSRKYTAIMGIPGTGKTEVLKNAAEQMIDDLGIKSHRILHTTHTKGARDEMQRRIANDPNTKLKGIQSRTLHSIALKGLQRLANSDDPVARKALADAGLSRLVDHIDPERSGSISSAVVDETGMNLLLEKNDAMRELLADPKTGESLPDDTKQKVLSKYSQAYQYLLQEGFAAGNIDSAEAAAILKDRDINPSQFSKIFKQQESYFKNTGKMSFGHIMRSAVEIAENAEGTNLVNEMFDVGAKGIVVDEANQLNNYQYRLLNLVGQANNPDRFIAGADPIQSPMWNFASSQVGTDMMKSLSKIGDFGVVGLGMNYRLREGAVDWLSSHYDLENLDTALPKDRGATRSARVQDFLRVNQGYNESDTMAMMSNDIRHVLSKNTDPGKIAVQAWTNEQLDTISKRLTDDGIRNFRERTMAYYEPQLYGKTEAEQTVLRAQFEEEREVYNSEMRKHSVMLTTGHKGQGQGFEHNFMYLNSAVLPADPEEAGSLIATMATRSMFDPNDPLSGRARVYSPAGKTPEMIAKEDVPVRKSEMLQQKIKELVPETTSILDRVKGGILDKISNAKAEVLDLEGIDDSIKQVATAMATKAGELLVEGIDKKSVNRYNAGSFLDSAFTAMKRLGVPDAGITAAQVTPLSLSLGAGMVKRSIGDLGISMNDYGNLSDAGYTSGNQPDMARSMRGGMGDTYRFGRAAYAMTLASRAFQRGMEGEKTKAGSYGSYMSSFGAFTTMGGDTLAESTQGFTTAQINAERARQRGAYEVFGGFTEVSAIRAATTEGANMRWKSAGNAGMNIGAGLAQASFSMMLMGNGMADMAGAGGALGKAATALGSGSLIAGAAVLGIGAATMVGMEIYNANYLKPDEQPKAFGQMWSSVSYEREARKIREEISGHKYPSQYAKMPGYKDQEVLAVEEEVKQRMMAEHPELYRTQYRTENLATRVEAQAIDIMNITGEGPDKVAPGIMQLMHTMRPGQDVLGLSKTIAGQSSTMGLAFGETIDAYQGIGTTLGLVPGTNEYAKFVEQMSQTDLSAQELSWRSSAASQIAQVGSQYQSYFTSPGVGIRLAAATGRLTQPYAAASSSAMSLVSSYGANERDIAAAGAMASINTPRYTSGVLDLASKLSGVGIDPQQTLTLLGMGEYQTIQGEVSQTFGSQFGGSVLRSSSYQQFVPTYSNQEIGLMSMIGGGDLKAASYAHNTGALGGMFSDPKFGLYDRSGNVNYETSGLNWAKYAVANKLVGAGNYNEFGDAIVGEGGYRDIIGNVLEGLPQEYIDAFTDKGMRGVEAVSRKRSAEFSMASAGIQMQQLQANRTFYWGQGGSWDNPTSDSMWGMEDRMRAMQYRSQTTSFAVQERQMGIQFGYEDAQRSLDARRMKEGHSYQRYNMDYSQSMAMRQQQWAREDWGYQDTVNSLNFEWGMEDFGEAIRNATGRQRRLLIQKRDRSVTTHNLEQEQLDTTRDRQEEMWAIEDERMSRQKTYQEEMMQIEKESFEINKRYQSEMRGIQVEEFERFKAEYEERFALEDEMTARQREHQAEMFELQERSIGISAAAAKEQYDVSERFLNEVTVPLNDHIGEISNNYQYGGVSEAFDAFSDLLSDASNVNVAYVESVNDMLGSLTNSSVQVNAKALVDVISSISNIDTAKLNALYLYFSGLGMGWGP